MVDAIVLDDQAPQPVRADAELQEALGIWKDDADHVTAMLQQVRGWWVTTTRQMLDPANLRRVSPTSTSRSPSRWRVPLRPS